MHVSPHEFQKLVNRTGTRLFWAPSAYNNGSRQGMTTTTPKKTHGPEVSSLPGEPGCVKAWKSAGIGKSHPNEQKIALWGPRQGTVKSKQADFGGKCTD
jgi:hypothetical protein